MGDIYRVVVTREGAETDDVSVIVELAAPAEVLARFAPAAVASVLGSTIEDDVPGGVYAEPVRHEQAGQPKQRRPRRTKAEMEAARAAEIEKSAIAEPHNAMITERGNDGEPVAPMAMDGPAEVAAYNPFGPK